jgi:hypothetical protein
MLALRLKTAPVRHVHAQQPYLVNKRDAASGASCPGLLKFKGSLLEEHGGHHGEFHYLS